MIFDLKRKSDGSIDKYKASLVVRELQEGRVDDLYAPVIDFSTVPLALSCLTRGCTVHHLDVKNASLNGALESNSKIFSKSTQGMTITLEPGTGLKLLKALYRLKIAAKIWLNLFTDSVLSLAFHQVRGEDCFFIAKVEDAEVWIIICIDDIIVMSQFYHSVYMVTQILASKFELNDLGAVKSFLAVKFLWHDHELCMQQSHFTTVILQSFSMENCHSVGTPMVTQHTVTRKSSSHLEVYEAGWRRDFIPRSLIYRIVVMREVGKVYANSTVSAIIAESYTEYHSRR